MNYCDYDTEIVAVSAGHELLFLKNLVIPVLLLRLVTQCGHIVAQGRLASINLLVLWHWAGLARLE